MTLSDTLLPVLNRGVPPHAFVEELITWGRSAPDEIFEANANPADVFALVRGTLGPWTDLLARKAALLEVMRVHAGFESSWNWHEGVDRSNKTSLTHIEGQETGAWQVSFDSIRLGESIKAFAFAKGLTSPAVFILSMKENHPLAMEYYARLVRVSVAWAGPLISRKILSELSRLSMQEFEAVLA